MKGYDEKVGMIVHLKLATAIFSQHGLTENLDAKCYINNSNGKSCHFAIIYLN